MTRLSIRITDGKTDTGGMLVIEELPPEAMSTMVSISQGDDNGVGGGVTIPLHALTFLMAHVTNEWQAKQQPGIIMPPMGIVKPN